VLVRLDVEGKARWDGRLLGALEDGVFFDHGKTAPSGLVVSQTEVHDETKKRRASDVATIAAALKTLSSQARAERTRISRASLRDAAGLRTHRLR
jgi:hypothetical protein